MTCNVVTLPLATHGKPEGQVRVEQSPDVHPVKHVQALSELHVPCPLHEFEQCAATPFNEPTHSTSTSTTARTENVSGRGMLQAAKRRCAGVALPQFRQAAMNMRVTAVGPWTQAELVRKPRVNPCSDLCSQLVR